MADDKLVAELATAIHVAVDGPNCDCSLSARYEFRVAAKAALDFMGACCRPALDSDGHAHDPGCPYLLGLRDGRAEGGVPTGSRVEEQWAVPDDQSDPFPVLSERFARELSAVAGEKPLRRSVITTPWVAVQPDHGKASDG